MTNSNKRWVTELIEEEYKNWNESVVLLGFGTGRGKTTFALNVYCKYLQSLDKKVLYLCNRTKLREQIESDAKKYGAAGIDIMSYQRLSETIRYGHSLHYDVYICDEAHYFLSDAEFNVYTDLAYDHILNEENSTRVYMTATYENIFSKIKEDLREKNEKAIEYYLPTDYSYVDHVYWWKKKDDIYGIIDHLLKDTDDKIIYFCNSLKKMRDLYDHYSPNKGKWYEEDKKYLKNSKLQYMSFICSKNETEAEDVNNENYFIRNYCSNNHIIKNKSGDGFTFDNRILISTKVLDNGIDFKDQSIKHIICDVFDLETAIQCLGRKRILSEDDRCSFYIRDWQHNHLNLFLSGIEEQLESPTMFITENDKWIRKYGKDREHKDTTIYYDFDLKEHRINKLRFRKMISDKKMITKMIERKTSYRAEITKYLGTVNCVDIENIKKDHIKDAIEIWITEHMEQYLSNEQKEEFISLCDLKDRYGRQQKRISTLSDYLKHNYGFVITNKQHRVDKKRIKQWVISPYDDSGCQKKERPPC